MTAEEALTETFARANVGPMFVVPSCVGHPVYTAEPVIMLDCLRRGWLSINATFVLCAEHSPSVALFWEGTGPYFGKRGHRRLTAGTP
jgi:hypothetical protein